MPKLFRIAVFAAVVAAIVGGAIWGLQSPDERSTRHAGAHAAESAPIPVTTGAARLGDVPIYLEGVGTVKARNTVTVRAQVDGKIQSIDFKEGDTVRKGDVLARIDPATYKAQLEQAKAKKALDEALLANTKRDLERYEKVGTLAESQQQIDTQRALVQQQEAQVQADQAAIDNAQAVLGYTDIVAPISGRTGIRLIDEGNIVHNTDTAGIVVITEVQPISVVFTLPQQQLADIRKSEGEKALDAIAFTTDGKLELDRGTLQVIDNQIDPATGTVRLKAEFPNAKTQMWPGQFVNVRLLVETIAQALTVPTQAIQRGPNGTFVYIVNGDHSVATRTVTLGHQTENETVISSGLAAGDTIVLSGFGRLSDGAKIAAEQNDPAKAGSPDVSHEHRHHRENASSAP